MRITLRLSILLAFIFCTSGNPSLVVTVTSTPEVYGGPTCCLFDSPYTATLAFGPSPQSKDRSINAWRTTSYTSNQETKLFSLGSNIDYNHLLPNPPEIGLGPDPDPESVSHCGKWLNSAWTVPSDQSSRVVGFFHQEWNCNYAKGGYTNKSIGFAVSSDGGITFTPNTAQIIAGANFSTEHQTGEGDHTVVQVGSFLYLFYLEWDGPEGRVTVGVARATVESEGAPGSWYKYCAGAFRCKGVGGSSDLISTITGTGVFQLQFLSVLVSIGTVFSPSMDVAYLQVGPNDTFPNDSSIDEWKPALSGPLFWSDWSDWNRQPNSSELFAYPSLTAEIGSNQALPCNNSFVYFTYLQPGATFADRYLVRRPVKFFYPQGNQAVPALVSLTIWCNTDNCENGAWPTSGPVLGYQWSKNQGMFRVHVDAGYILTSAFNSETVQLVECLLHGVLPPVITMASECHPSSPGNFSSGAVLRTSGWLFSSLAAAESVGWNTTGVVQPQEGDAVYYAPIFSFWRCRSVTYPKVYYSAAVESSCGPGFSPEKLLGYGFGPLGPMGLHKSR